MNPKERNLNNEEIPAGNRWDSSANNILPLTEFREITDRDFLPEGLRDLLEATQRFVKPDWKFASALGNKEKGGVIFVFTNPYRTRLASAKNAPGIQDFINPILLKQDSLHADRLRIGAFDMALAGTNYTPVDAYANYNEMLIQERKGLLRRKQYVEKIQCGVAYIHIGLWTLEEEIESLEEQIRSGGIGGLKLSDEQLDMLEKEAEELRNLKKADPLPLLTPFE